MKINPLRIMTLGLAGLVATGLIAFQQGASASTDQSALKRDEDTPDVVLVDDEDDDDSNRLLARDDNTDTNSRSGNSGDASRTGAASGRDDSRSGRRVKDWTGDNTNTRKRDWSQNRTNDRSRHNTR